MADPQERDFNWCVQLVERIIAGWPHVRKHVYSEHYPESARFFFGRGWERYFIQVGCNFIDPLRLEIRSNEISLPAFERGHPSSNWWWIAPDDIDPEALEPLVKQSYDLCQLRHCGVVSSDPLKEAHVLLNAALKACDKSCWPPPPWHLGGPKPSCPIEDQERIADWCSTLLADLDLDTLDKRVRQKVVEYTRGDVNPAYAGPANTVRLVVKAYAANPGRTRSLLEEIDRRILIGELEQKRRPHLQPGQEESPIQEVLWRGTDEKGNLSAWIARLEQGGYGLLAKLGRKWTWVEGDRDSVLATVPDALFEAAAVAMRSTPPVD